MLRRPPSKREAQREQTRSRLQAAALERFRRDGFDATSVASVAAAVGVTERTFFRHFPTKEAVLFQDYESRLDWFARALEERPLDEPVVESVVAAIGSFPDDTEILRQIGALRQSVLSQATIATHLLAVQAAFADELEPAVRAKRAHRRSTGALDETDEQAELASVVLSRAIAGALFGVLEVWTRRGGGSEDDMAPLTLDAFALLTTLEDT
jgi:AcrR family transcriptional regulator